MAERRSLGRVISDHAAARPADTAVTCDDERISWSELDTRSNALARDYASAGVPYGGVVMIVLPNGIGCYVAAIAAWKAGAVPALLPAAMPAAEFDRFAALARPALVVGRTSGATHLPAEAVTTPGSTGAPLPDVVAPAWKIAATGGSTGRPKLVVADRSATFAAKDAEIWRMQGDDTQLVAGPLHHAAPFMMSILGLCLGHHLVVLPSFDATRALDAIARCRVTWLCLVPTMMSRLERVITEHRRDQDLASVRCLWHLGAPCPEWLKRRWIELVGADRIMELYGGTEAQTMTAISGSEWLAHPGSVGRPFYGEVKIVDQEGAPLPAGQVGEILMRPPARHGTRYRYIGAERVAREGWDSLGDLGWLDGEGYLYIADRRTDLVVSGGANVYPAEVEAAIEAVPGVHSCVVVGLPDHDLGQRVHAVVQADPDVSKASLLAYLADRVVRYKLPRSVEFVAGPLRDEAGKVRRAAIREAAIRRGLGPTPA